MPLIVVTANRHRQELTDDFLFMFGQQLRTDIAETLTCTDPGGQLTAEDIEVKIEDRVPKRSIGGEKYDLQVTVFANDYPSRKANLAERGKQLKERVRHALPQTLHGFVWILLSPAAFEEF